jgi:hypothetical protein
VYSFISAIVAAFFAHYFATSRMKRDDLSKFRMAAYTDFISASSKLAVLRRLGDTDSDIDILAALNDAKNRIIMCGSKQSVEALNEFWLLGGTLEGERELIAFRHLSQVIRSEFGYKSHDLHSLDISNTMFKLEPSNYSFRASNREKNNG